MQRLASLAWLSLPLGLATAGLALMTSIPRYAIGYYLGDEAIGGFAVAGGLMVAISLVVGALSQAAVPRMASHYARGDIAAFARTLAGVLIWVGGVGIAVVVIMAIAGGPILGFLYGPQFSQYAPLAVCLMLAAALRNLSVPLGRAIACMRRFRTNLVVRLIGIFALGILLPGMVPSFGLMGAAWALVFSWLLTILISATILLRALRSAHRAKNVTESASKSQSSRLAHWRVGSPRATTDSHARFP